MIRPVIIIGSGLAGYNVAREFRKLDKTTPLLIITRDSGEFYSKPMLSNSLANNKQPDQLAMKNSTQMATELNAEILTRQTVTAIDRLRQHITLAGEERTYEKLVLAMGADQIDPKLTGDAQTDVLTVNDLDDYRHCRTLLAEKRRVVILGAGLIGCEFANDWCSAGFDVSLIDPAGWPLSRLLPEQAGAWLQQRLGNIGVRFQLGVTATTIEHTNDGYRLSLSDGSTLEADLVLSAIGLKPRTRLATEAGLVAHKGIVVNRSLQTNDPNIYALGDCAEVDGLSLPFVMPIMQAARTLAPILAGQSATLNYPAMPVLVKTPACPTTVCPPPKHDGQWQITETTTGLKALFMHNGQLMGFALLGDTQADKQTLVNQTPGWLR
ncbi:FAD-dependent oxidoreductase [Chitinivorax sp. B]|uniref:NAD(P)/FAD-dependent oxidoreductase n=1 Tax=Chitinivorax sp. B TaxID=2502235 RepID=UPI0010F5D743|nr:FAD-dependent oxidoreductase [Chitinivorax sp. B]